ncbi:nose resistant to fluoxetine protein 6-like [Trichoplusia ni]|uniref:Nose resistant to fluoxetine protein 6-like n=1 Tax=Trichoplusia ni TaxID=7111 RepID=A0A7E5W4S7_TRINI|nr:nose resistant to fluoxetine protein 6-like [Trichoplusia ni]
MRYICLLVLGLVAINKIKCHVTDRVKILENSETITTQTPVGNKTQIGVKGSEKHESPKAVKNSDGSVYLDDVLFTLKNQNWTDEEEPCLKHIKLLLYSLQNFTLWAVWDWDSQASEPQGLLFANRYQLGNFDQCMSAPWAKTHKELKTKYCLAEIVLERTDKAVRKRVEKPYYPYESALDYIEHRPPHSRPLNELTWGACVPAACAPSTVERLLGVMLARSHLGAAGMRANISVTETCQSNDDEMEYDSLFYAFFIVIGLLVIISLACTYLNCRRDSDERKPGIIQSFCIRENTLDLLRMKKEGIEVFYGIRFLTICLIVLDHQIGIYNSGPISDGFTSDQDVQSPLGLLILHDDLFVDTFFLLSGFLVVTNIAKMKRMPNPLLLILKRYVRLMVAFAVVIFYVCAVFPYTGTGPLWNRAVAHDTEQCRKNWWLNLLMVSNYIDTENICIVVSWYIPCDFHFFVVTVLAYYVYRRVPTLGVTIATVLTVAAVVLPGVINYIYQLSAVQLFTFEFVMNPRGNEEFHVTYIKSHTRFAAYLVGFYSGYLFVTYSKDGNLNRIKQKWSVLGTCAALLLMLVVMVFGSTFLWRSYHPLEGAVYAALNRPAWACGVALLVLCCSFGNVPLVKSFLSWYPWVPLSRLSYGLYLTHTILITRNVFITRNPQHNDYFEIINSTTGVIFWGCIGALLLWLFAEAPANKLLSLCLRSKGNKNTAAVEPTPTSIRTSENNMPTSSGHLHGNLPDTIHFSSKF